MSKTMKNTLTVMFFLAVASSGLMATDIFVQPGENTITAALATAEAGDRLVLVQEGVYSNDPLFVLKPITIAAFDGLATKPIVSFLWSTDTTVVPLQERTIAFTYASLTLEGLEFTMEGDTALMGGLNTRMFRNRAYKDVNWKFTDCLFRNASQATMSITNVLDSFMVADGSWHFDGIDYSDNDPFVVDGDTIAQSGLHGVLDTLIIDNCVFNDFLLGGPKINHKPGHGRGVYSYIQFTNNTVSNTDHHAISFAMRDVDEGSDNSLYGTAVIDHNTIHGIAGGSKNAIMLKYVNSASTIMNTTLTDISNQVINIQESDSVLVDYCNWYNSGSEPVQQWTDGGHNLQVDPLFADASANDFTLLTGSPLIGAGSDGSTIGAPVEPNSIAALTVHEVDGALGTTVSVPVDIELLGVDISSAEIRFSGFQDQLEFLGLDMEGTLIGDAEWEVEVNEQEDVLITASAGANNISGSGTLFRLNFDIPTNSDEYFVPIYIIEAQLNEYTEPIDFVDGGVHIQYVMYGDVSQNGDVSAYDAALVLKYLVGLEELDENQLLAADVTLDGSVSALDASVILQYVVELIDELPYDDVATLAGTGDIGMEDGVFTPGDLLEIPIQLANGENLLSFEMDVAYDPEIVSFEMVDWSDMIEHFSIEENNESGLLRVAGSGSTPDGEEGVFGSLQVFVDGGFEGEYFEISISTYRVNENEPVEDIVATFTNSALGLDHNSIPEVFALHQNYPNPFNPVTTLRYDLPEDALVDIIIYDLMGRSIKSLVNSNQSAGYRSIQWNGTDQSGQVVSAGLYIYRITAGDYSVARKMILLK
jgi:hypothetical protein